MKTKIYSLLLLLLGLLPGSLFAQTRYHYTDSEGTIWTYQLNTAGDAAILIKDPITNGPTGPMWVDRAAVNSFGVTQNYRKYTGDILHLPSTVSNGTNVYPVKSVSGLFMNGTYFEIEKLILPASLEGSQLILFHSCIRRIVAEPGNHISGFGQFGLAGWPPADFAKDETAIGNVLYYDFSECPLDNITGDPGQYLAFFVTHDNALLFTKATTNFQFNDRRMKSNFTGSDNVVRDGVCASLHIDDEEDFESPRTFTATQAKYERVFSNVAGKAVSTLYLPYPTDLPNGMRAYTLIRKGFDENGDKAFCFASVPAGTRLEAYKPYLVQITDGASHTLPTMHNVTVPATPNIETSAIQASDDSDWKFYGTTLRIKNDKAYAKKAYYLNGNKWWAVQNGVTNDYIAPFRCFISSPTGAVPAKSFLMVLDEEDNNTTGIKSLENKTNEDIKSGKYPFYSVDGKLIGNDYNALESGQIYIVNGKKFYKI